MHRSPWCSTMQRFRNNPFVLFVMIRALFILTLWIIGIDCIPKSQDDSKVVGGYYIRDISIVPWIVSIRKFFEGEGFAHDCGGSLLTLEIVLTACHCLQGGVRDFEFVAGSVDLENKKAGQVRSAKRIIVHPECVDLDEEGTFDVGVAIMKKSFQKTKFVKTMNILSWNPKEFESKMRPLLKSRTSNCFVAGWGVVRNGGNSASRYLKGVRMYPITGEQCRNIYGKKRKRFRYFDFDKVHQQCGVSRYLNESDCIGDSGGPFTCKGYTVAVVSYGFECGTPTPSVYVTLPYFLEWYQKKLKSKYHGTSSVRRTSQAARVGPFKNLCLSGVLFLTELVSHRTSSFIVTFLSFVLVASQWLS
ncbi:hypothetical protein GE061_013210 [Apolygus lucorum]|uniref:Peptidase S1 domain-containing protein n=1 Tax=Apolygus lucorum TaxID=248454 RepID=A0A8S9XVR9_APOLU|nr:hypothetical protein GE061_013210 [Apolygus lucorum]